MGQINVRDFNAGYTPDDDYLNGNPNGQIRMDNLCLEETGAIILSRTSQQVNKVLSGQDIISCYSKWLNGKLYRFCQLGNYTVWVDADQSGNFATNVCANASGPRPAAYGAGFGNIFVSNGIENKRFDGTKVLSWGGLVNFAPPQISQLLDAVSVHWYGPDAHRWVTTFSLVSGSNLVLSDGYCSFNTGAGNSGVVRCTPLGAQNFNDFVNSTDVGAPTDQFALCVNTPNGYSSVTNLEVRAYTNATTYFSFTWGTSRFTNNFNYWILLTCNRSDFSSVGGTPNWGSIIYTEVRVTSTTPTNITFTQPWEFYNSNDSMANIKTGLDGSSPFTYYQQNLTRFTGTAGKSPMSPASRPIFGKWSAVGIIPTDPHDTRTYEADIYKTGGELSGNYYFIGYQPIPLAAAPNNVVWDTQTALETQSEGQIADSGVFLADLPPGIRMIEGPLNGRMILMTDSSVYFTDYMNPEAIDDRMTIQPSNSADEICLFLTRSSNTILTLATTQDFYEISGTWAELENGVFDIYNRPAGIKQPAISPSFCILDNAIIYVSATAIRQLGFSVTQSIGDGLSLFFKGLARYGVPGFYTDAYDTDKSGLRWALAYAKRRIYFKVFHIGGSTSVFILDIIKKSWTRRTDGDVISFYTEESGELLVGRKQGYIGIYDKQWNQDVLNYPTTQTFFYQSACQPTDTPFQRKDLFTLKIWMATAGANVSIYLVDENLNQVNLGQYSTPSNLVQQIFIRVHGCSIDLSQRFSLIITGTTPVFKLTNWVLDYDERPPRELFLYIPPSNFGSPSKKRVRTLPMMIDTFGLPVQYTPIVDLQTQSKTSTFSTNGKQTVYHLFDYDIFGTDYGGTLEAQTPQPFEFYNLMNPVSVEELPPPKLYDQVGPYALDKKGKIYGFRVRMVSFTTSILYSIFGDDVVINAGIFNTQPGVDTTYEVLRLPPGLIANVVRIEFSSPDNTKPFMRWYVQLRCTASGMGTDEKWITIAGKVGPTE